MMQTHSQTDPAQKPDLFRLGIGQKLTLAMCALLAVLMVSGVMTFWTSLDLATISRQTADSARALSLTGYLNNFGARQKYIANDFLITQREFDRKSYAEAGQGFVQARRDLQEIFARDEPQLLSFLSAYGDLHDEWQTKVGDEEFRLGVDPAQAEQGRALLKSDLSQALSDRSRATGTALGTATQDWADRWTAESQRELTFLRTVILFSILTGIAVAGLIGWLLIRAISKPLSSMTSVMKRLATGDLAVAIPAIGRKDEIGDMAGAVQVFKDAAIQKLRLEKEADERRRQHAEAERVRIESGEAEAARMQGFALESLAMGLEHLSNSDLTYRLQDAFAPQYEKLRDDFNKAIGTLQVTVKAVATNTAAIRSGTSEISIASDDLSRRTEQQAASLEQTAAALDEITATVKKTSDGSIHARSVVGSAKADAERSGTVVGQAVEAMSAIEQSAQKVSQIIGVIDEIAFQTNLLALNAGVEAARAGEAGRGFAVVASEVRALAQRTAEAAKEIKALISLSSQQVSTGVNLVKETGAALKRIVTQVTEINAVVSDIATSTQEQATALQEVNTAINQMDQVTQQNAAMVEETTAASKSLAQETEELARLIGQFQLDNGSGARRSPVTSLKAKQIGTTAPALKTRGSGGAARKQEAETQSWEEF